MPLMVTRMTYLISTRSLVMALASTSLRDSSSSSSFPAWAAKVTRKGSSCRTDTGASLSSVMYSRVISSMPSTVRRPPTCSHPVITGVAKAHSTPLTAGLPSGSISRALPLSAACSR